MGSVPPVIWASHVPAGSGLGCSSRILSFLFLFLVKWQSMALVAGPLASRWEALISGFGTALVIVAVWFSSGHGRTFLYFYRYPASLVYIYKKIKPK